MFRSISTTLCAVSIAFLLAACGGGGDGGGGGVGDGPSPAVTFDPKTLVANYATGTSQMIDITATATRPEDFENETLYVYIVDPTELLNKAVTLTEIDDKSVLVSLETSPSTAPGHYTGDFTVQLCKDAGCSSQFRGSPVKLPYDITVTP